MAFIEREFSSHKRNLNTIEHQRKSIAFLKDSLREVISTLSPLDTPYQHNAGIGDILDELLKNCECDFIRNVRYYRYSEEIGDGAYTLVDSAGYDRDSARHLRVGELVRFKSSCKLNRTDTFWAHRTGVPVAVSVNRQAPNAIEPNFFSGCLPLVEVPIDTCEESLQDRQTSMWIDVPLSVGGEHTGKLSCDFNGVISDLSAENSRLVAFWANAQLSAAVLEFLASRKRKEVSLTEIVGDIQSCETVDSLFDYCIEKLPAYFGCKNASIFTISTDSLGISKLVPAPNII